MAAMDTFMPGIRTGNFAPCRAGRIGRKPLDPLFIHPGEVCLFKKDNGGAHDTIERSTRCLEDGRHILEALPGLLLDRIPDDLSGGWVKRPGS